MSASRTLGTGPLTPEILADLRAAAEAPGPVPEELRDLQMRAQELAGSRKQERQQN